MYDLKMNSKKRREDVMKKKVLAIMLAGTMVFSMAACGNGDTGSGDYDDQVSDDISVITDDVETGDNESDTASDSNVVSDAVTASEQNEDAAVSSNQTSGDVLIIYFSADNTKDVDAVSSATPMVSGVSSTQWMAETIHDVTGGDIVKIIPSGDYPLEYDDVADAAKAETDSDARPAFEPLDVDPTSYKTVFIGYPMWWYTIPMVMETFFDTYDFSGVTIVPFNTHAGSRDGGTYETIKEREPNANVLDGLAVSGGSAGNGDTKTEIIDWVNGLNLN